MKGQIYLKSITIKESSKQETRFPFNMEIFKKMNSFHFNKPMTFFIGENGIGKSTLLEAIAIKLGMNAEGGSINFDFSTSSTDKVSCLQDYLKIIRTPYHPKDNYFFRAETYYNLATEIERIDQIRTGLPRLLHYYGDKSLHVQSHGESFLALMNRINGNGIFLFDEPESALSITSQLAFLRQIDYLLDNNSQIIIATHSPILLAYPYAEIYQFETTGIRRIEYKQTSNYLLMKEFINNPNKMIDYILGDKPD